MDQLRAALIAIVVAGIISAGISFMARTTTQNIDDERYGAQAGAVVAAARQFAYATRSNIITAVTSAGGAAVTYHVSDMIAVNVIDPSISPTTPTGGIWCLEFRTYNGGANLQGILTVVNETTPKTAIDAAVVAQNAGTAFTGVVDAAVQNVVYPSGAQALSAFTGANTCAPGPNAFAAVITDNDSIGTTNWLARVSIPGNPSANRMTVDLDMGGNNINNIANATATGTVTAGNLAATTSVASPVYFHTSDRSLKNHIQAITDPWRLLAPIAGSRWLWNANGRPGYGVIAQDVQKTMPELVSTDARGKLQVDYDGLLAPVIAELKRLHAREAADGRKIARLQHTLGPATPRKGSGLKMAAGVGP